jgi:S-adenosylmethionine hydrolase
MNASADRRTGPIITLLTDFGTQDHYVASMKGTILGINPRCNLIDITHQISPHDIKEGAFILANACLSFPKGTIHLGVVDPGVGSLRKPILLVTKNYIFLGPDNGLLTVAARQDNIKQAFALTNPKFFRSFVSTTFHGRDIFAPIAGHLSRGMSPKTLGQKIGSWVDLVFENPVVRGNELMGKVVHTDAFGNLITNITQKVLADFVKNKRLVLGVGKTGIQGLREGYWEVKKGDPVALIGSGGLLEISIREGNAGKVLKVRAGAKVRVRVQEKSEEVNLPRQQKATGFARG